MAGFMDKVFTVLSADPAHEPTLTTIRNFIQNIRGSAAYVRTDLLNIEELYGLAELDRLFPHDGSVKGDQTVQEAFNTAIYLATHEAGNEFVKDFSRFKSVASSLNHIKRESQTEEIGGPTSVNHYTNLLAYLCLASFQEQRKSASHSKQLHPLFIQFNWDLALDRALWCNHLTESKATAPVPDQSDAEYMPWLHLKQDNYSNFDFTKSSLVLRPHGAINWAELNNTQSDQSAIIIKKLSDMGFEIGTNFFIPSTNDSGSNPYILTGMIDGHHIFRRQNSEKVNYRGSHMNIAPPTWKKDPEQFLGQWQAMRQYLATVRRIVFIGYSMPKSDLYFRHFLALALSENNYAPKVYIWNPGISKLGPVRESYTDLFAPLAREGRLYGIDGYFGDPALYDLNRVFHIAKRIDASAG
ncbi:MAG: hypothetical protein H7841_18275 [Magnetospirillum sp. WYHS-4]